jgi:lysyl-tRNA synthetase class 2
MADSDWRPLASLEVIKKRAELLQQIRAFFHARSVMEVETPIMSAAGNTDPQIKSFVTHYDGPAAPAGGQMFLQTSPEFAMKRLLAAGSGAIYQLCKVFRNGEAGHHHNPEFTMLEWYRPGYDHHALMDEVEALLIGVLPVQTNKVQRISYQQVFIEHAGFDPLVSDMAVIRDCASQHGLTDIVGLAEQERDGWLDLLMDQVIMPKLRGMVFIYDYPASQASLARIKAEDPRVAERFECFIDGIELANGFHELTDASEQQQRFLADNKKREATDQPTLPVDNKLIDALEQGMPACAGVALGVDRLLMLSMGASSIAEVLAFPIDRA